jgi:hypothetical protein
MKRHWSETYGCACGARFTSYAAGARHRHNYPLLCRQPKVIKTPTLTRVWIDEAGAITPENFARIGALIKGDG